MVLAEYKRLSCVLDKEIEFNVKGQKYKGIVKDINDFGNLVVESDGKEMILNSGEISIIGEFYETK